MHALVGHSGGRPLGRTVRWAAGALLVASLGLTSCTQDQKKAEPPPPRYSTLPARENLPAFMKGTIYEFADLGNKDPYPVSGFGLVVGLANTGDNSNTPMAVRGYMIDTMVQHGFGVATVDDDLRGARPEQILSDPRTAIVEVYGFLPPGARSGQRVDIFVQAVMGSGTKSLARGVLYQTNLYVGGANRLHPQGHVNVFMKARGPVFVNPALTRTATAAQASVQAGLRAGTILNGGMVVDDRPIYLRARSPELRTTRAMEKRIDERFQDDATAKTQDEGIVHVLVPKRYNGDWQHFLGVVTHLYLNNAPGNGALKAKELVAEALKPEAFLQEISYCWEGIGEDALPYIRPMYTNASPAIAFAAARAGVFITDSAAEAALLEMARSDGHPYQLNAVKTLGALPESVRIDRMLAELLPSKNTLVRIEAYTILADHSSPAIISREVNLTFVLDQVLCDGPPLIYATRSGVPRIAIFGKKISLTTPMMFSAMDDRLTIASPPGGATLNLFDRTNTATGTALRVSPDLGELVWRMGGGSAEGIAFGYSDVVGILQSLSSGHHMGAAFVLQDLPALQESIEDAPPLVEPNGQPEAAGAASGGDIASTPVTAGAMPR